MGLCPGFKLHGHDLSARESYWAWRYLSRDQTCRLFHARRGPARCQFDRVDLGRSSSHCLTVACQLASTGFITRFHCAAAHEPLTKRALLHIICPDKIKVVSFGFFTGVESQVSADRPHPRPQRQRMPTRLLLAGNMTLQRSSP